MYTENITFAGHDKNNVGLSSIASISESRTSEELKSYLDNHTKGSDYQIYEVICVSGEQIIKY